MPEKIRATRVISFEVKDDGKKLIDKLKETGAALGDFMMSRLTEMFFENKQEESFIRVRLSMRKNEKGELVVEDRMSEEIEPIKKDELYEKKVAELEAKCTKLEERTILTPACATCGQDNARTTLYMCSCHSIVYCSLQCQKQDWKRHKRVCKKINSCN